VAGAEPGFAIEAGPAMFLDSLLPFNLARQVAAQARRAG
jgi:hypothetical protein